MKPVWCGKAIRFSIFASIVFTLNLAVAQDIDPLALSKANPDLDLAKSQQILAEDFAGIWRVTHADNKGEGMSGRAQVAVDGASIDLTLQSSEETLKYDLIEAEAIRFPAGSGTFKAALIARFKKVGKPASKIDEESLLVVDDMHIALPLDHDVITFEEGDLRLELPIVWSEGNLDQIRVEIYARNDDGKFEGRWMEERIDEFKGGGIATWIKGGLSIDGVLVLENQLESSAGTNYPFNVDGSPINHVRDERTLVIYGKNLPDIADGADIQSQSEFIVYRPEFSTGDDRGRKIANAFKIAGVKRPEGSDALLIIAELKSGILPGFKSLTVDGEEGEWPLVFANGQAKFRFSRGALEPTQTFYVGDSGRVELSLLAEIPFENINVSLLRGGENPEEVGVLTAIKIDTDEGEPGHITYQTEEFHLYSHTDASLSPPENKNSMRVPAAEGMILQAALLDPAEAITVPRKAIARVYSSPDQLGGLWKEALDRVATCYGETIEDYDTYPNQEASRISKIILTALVGKRPGLGGRNDILLSKGDHAAALLIADEFISMTMVAIQPYDRMSANEAYARAVIKNARSQSAVANSDFWQESKAIHVEDGYIWDTNTEIPLIVALDTEWVAKKFEMSHEEVQSWTYEQVVAAAKREVLGMQAATSRVVSASDCNLDELLVVAGHKVDPVIANIMPRLVKLEINQGPPKRQHWVRDPVAESYVRGLYLAGAAVRGLEGYSEIDTKAALAAAGILAKAAGIGLELGGQMSAAYWPDAVVTAADFAVGAHEVGLYREGESFLEFAQGATPVMGDDIMADAWAGRKSQVMTAIGVLLPAAVGAHSINSSRNFKNVAKGKALLQGNPGVLDDLTKLTDAERTAVAGYYSDLLARARRSGVDKLDTADRAALDAFGDYFEKSKVASPSIAHSTPNGTRLDDTVDEAPPTVDPRLDPGNRDLADVIRDAPVDDSPALRVPAGALDDFVALEPGALSHHLSANEVERLFDPTYVPTAEEIIQKADLIRDGRVPLYAAQGDPEVLRALDAAFGLKRNRPAVTGNGTIIDSVRPDEVDGPGAGGGSTTVDTVIESGRSEGSVTTDTVIDSHTGEGSGSVSFHPEFIEENAGLRNTIKNNELANQLARVRESEEAALAAETPGVQYRLMRLTDAQEMLSRGTPKQLQVASEIDQAERALGISDFDAMAHTSLFYKRVGDVAKPGGLSLKMEQAEVVAEGFMLYGQHPISIANFAQTNNISQISARTLLEAAAEHAGIPQSGGMFVPARMTH